MAAERVWPSARCFGLVSATYGVAVQLGLALRDPAHPIALFWPAAGVGAVLMIIAVRTDRRTATVTIFGILAANLVLNALAGHGPLVTLGFSAANVLESAIVGVVFAELRRVYPSPGAAIPSLLASAMAAVGASTAVAMALLLPQLDRPWWEVASNWAVPDYAGVVVVGALILAPHGVPSRRRLETLAQAATLAALMLPAYWLTTGLPLAWLPIPALIWSGMRLGTTWTAVSSGAVAFTLAVATARGHGPFVLPQHAFTVQLAGQVFAGVMVCVAMTLACAVEERYRMARDLAVTDSLTGLANRRLLDEHAARVLGPRRRPGTAVALLYCDVDRFKHVNDQYGHDAGDEVLRGTARLLTECVRPTDVVARLGGDEFAVLCADLRGPDEAAAIRRRVERASREPVTTRGVPRRLPLSVGLAYTDEPATLDELLRLADRAMYVRKRLARQLADAPTAPDQPPVEEPGPPRAHPSSGG